MNKSFAAATVYLILLARSSAQMLLQDSFNYPDGQTTVSSGGLWLRHSGSANDSFIKSGRLEVFSSRADDIHRDFTNTAGSVVYASFIANMSILPNAAGNYFGHLNTTNFRCKIFALTGTGLSVPRSWRLGISAADNVPSQTVPLDLATNVDYHVVIRYD